MYYVYLLLCKDKSIYCGITTDVARRLQEHKDGQGGSYTRAHKAVKILYTEKFQNRSTATKRELEIKSLTKAQKLKLIKNGK